MDDASLVGQTTDAVESLDVESSGAHGVAGRVPWLNRLRYLLFVVVAALVATGLGVMVLLAYAGGVDGGSELLRYVPEEADMVAVWDMGEILGAGYAVQDFGGFEVRAWDLPYAVDGEDFRVGSLWLEGFYVDYYLMAVDLDEGAGFSLVRGRLDFGGLREALEDVGYRDGVYRTFEVWSGRGHYALLEEEGIVLSASERGVLRSVLNGLYLDRPSVGSVSGHELGGLLDQAGPGAFVFAVADSGSEWGCSVPRCLGYGVSLREYDPVEGRARAEFAVLFSSERSAERAAEEYDRLLDFAESVQSNGFFSFGGIVAVEDAVAEGRLVVGQAWLSPR